MTQSDWTQRALAALERADLIQTGMVNIRHGEQGEYVLEVADNDNDIHALTVRTTT